MNILVYRGLTRNETDRFLVTTDRSIAEFHSDRIRVYRVDHSKLESGDEEIGFYAGDVPANKVGEIEAFVNLRDLTPIGEYKKQGETFNNDTKQNSNCKNKWNIEWFQWRGN